MKKCMFVGLIVLATFAVANEWPYVPGMDVKVGTTDVKTDRVAIEPVLVTEPVWKSLENMASTDRQNSQIGIVLEMNASQEALTMARRIENLWNGGNYDEALSRFPELAKITNADEMAIGNAWRVPVQTQTQGAWWGNDVRIGNRDSVLINTLDIHRTSGNLFSAFLYTGDGNAYNWCLNWSTNGGLTWSETYNWWATYRLKSLSLSVVGNFCHAAFGRGAAQDQAFLYRFNCTTGAQTNFNNGSAYVTVFTSASPDSIQEVALTSNHDFYNNRLYYLAISKNGNLRFYWDDTAATSWTQVTTNVNYANHGLDASCNEGYATYYLWATYVSNRDSLHIDANSSSDVWTKFLRYPVGSFGDYTAIGAWRDTIMTVFDHLGPVAGHVRYLTSYNGGANWFYGVVGGDTATTAESPDIACREGGGQGVAYRYYTPTRQERYTWRRYVGSWSTPVSIADHEPYYDKPSIEYLGSNIYGTVYTRWAGPNRAVYFDRSDWIGVAEENTSNLTQLGRLAPNPMRKLTNLTYALKNGGNVRIALYDATGRVVKTLVNEQMNAGEHSVRINAQNLPAGVYFVRMDTPDGVSSTPMTIVK